MPNIEVVIICHDCQGYNKHQAGTKNFEFRETNFTNFSDAHNHMMQYPNHWMSIEVREETEDD